MRQDWITREISSGLQKLILLSLDRQPALDVITPGTLPAWEEAITHGRVFDQQRDAPRFQAAFRTLLRTSAQWPNPQQFIAALPPIEEVKATPKLENEASRERVQKHLDDFAHRMRWDRAEDEGGDVA